MSNTSHRTSIFHRTALLISMFCLGGTAYSLIEILWRGHSHWSMFLVGGAGFLLVGRVQRTMAHLPRLYRCALCAIGISALEFASGCVLNLIWKLDVWDYTMMPLNLLGQVCLLYSMLWCLLSLPAMWLYRRCLGALNQHLNAVSAENTP